MKGYLRHIALASALVAGTLSVASCTPGYTLEVVETCDAIRGKDAPVEMEVSAVEFFFEGEFREHAVTNYYIVTKAHGKVKVDLEVYALSEIGEPYCTSETVRVPKAA